MTTVEQQQDRAPAAGASGMRFEEFLERFGGSLRTSSVAQSRSRRAVTQLRSGLPRERAQRYTERVTAKLRQDPRASAERFAARRGDSLAKTLAPPKANRRPYRLPTRSELPADFIRLDPWEADYLFLLAGRARLGVVETGRLRGGSTLMLACANALVPITSVDIAPKDDAYVRAAMRRIGVGDNVELIVGDSQHTAYDGVGEIDLLWIDGDHTYEGALADLRNWWPKVVPGGHVILHDCYHGSEVQPAVLDFLEGEEHEVVRTPFIPTIYWHQPAGSLVHVRRRG